MSFKCWLQSWAVAGVSGCCIPGAMAVFTADFTEYSGYSHLNLHPLPLNLIPHPQMMNYLLGSVSFYWR